MAKMSNRNTAQLREKDAQGLQEELTSLLKAQFTLRLQKSLGTLENGHQLRFARRAIARVKTLIAEQTSAHPST